MLPTWLFTVASATGLRPLTHSQSIALSGTEIIFVLLAISGRPRHESEDAEKSRLCQNAPVMVSASR